MTAIAKPPNVAIGVLVVGVLWWLSQRRAVAGGVSTRTPVYGTNGALYNPTARGYLIPPSGTQPAANSTLNSLLAAGAALLGRVNGGATNSGNMPSVAPVAVDALVQGYGQGGPSMGYYGSTNNPSYTSPGEIVRAPDYVPSYTPDTAGEAAAQDYVLNHPDEFVSNPPPVYAYNSGIDSSGGWLDNQ